MGAFVPYQILLLPRTMVTVATLEWFFSGMSQLVSFNSICPGECFLAKIALKWLFIVVRSLMVTETSVLSESPSAQLAFIRHGLGMNQSMSTKIILVDANEVAYVTSKNGLSRVRIFVYFQFTFVREISVAKKALMRSHLIRGMDGPFMFAKCTRVTKILAANLALFGFDFRMSFFVTL